MLRFSLSKIMKIHGPVVGGARGGILPELTSNHTEYGDVLKIITISWPSNMVKKKTYAHPMKLKLGIN